MGVIDLASANSLWRGFDYYKAKKVVGWEQSGKYTYLGYVDGSEGNCYRVHLDVDHPRRSTCNCPFADGRRVVCKHMIALYFEAVPNAEENFNRQVKEWEEENKRAEQKRLDDLKKYVKSLSKAELQDRLYEALLEIEEQRNRYW